MKYLSNIDLSQNELQNAVIQRLASSPSAPVEGQVYYNTTSKTALIYANGAWLNLGVQGGAGATDISIAQTASTVAVNSSTGADGTITAATASVAGLMLPAQYTKLAGIANGADVTNAASVTAAGAVMNSATSTASMLFVVNENNMASNSATKVPTQASTKSYVDTSVAALVASAPGTLDTLNELATALGDDPNFATTVSTNINAVGTRVTALESNGGPVKKFATSIGDGTSTTYTITHNLGSLDVVAEVYLVSSGATVECDIVRTSTSAITVSASVAPATNTLRVVVTG